MKPFVVILAALTASAGNALAQTQAADAATQPYCAAVRGNGDSMSAHWGSLARMMETYGAPRGMAGGSSASITTFLWESAMLNPVLSQDSAFTRGNQMALMFKSIEGVTYHLYEMPDWKTLAAWVTAARSGTALTELKQALSTSTLTQNMDDTLDIKSALEKLHESKIFYGPAIHSLEMSITDPRQVMLFSARLKALKETLAVLGKFDAKNDAQLFVREGLVDFQALARTMGALGDFLSLRNASVDTVKSFQNFMNTCAAISPGRNWFEITKQNQSCETMLNDTFDRYFATYPWNQDSRIFETIGAHNLSIVATAVVDGASRDRFRALSKDYLATYGPTIGADYHVDDADLRIGYWGQNLDKVQANLQDPKNPLSALDKSRRFMSLGSATWFQILSLSPAEPGLASAQEFSSVGLKQNLLSVGGWGDLHPIPVLKAAGCEKVVYVQRRTGDAMFSEGVVKRFLNFSTPDWAHLDPYEQGTHFSDILNNNGDPTDMTSTWSKLYNLRNPMSSYAASLKAADAVICTDWNAYDAEMQFNDLIENSYGAPIYEAPGSSMVRAPGAQPTMITEKDNAVDPKLGYAPYSGCIPLQ